jgi:ADP-heptose:LPS heptosyltransferase
MYLLYAPVERFQHLPNGIPLITDEVKFYNNVAFCPKFYWRKYHIIQGCRDISPAWMRRKRQSRILNNILVIATGGYGDVMWTMPFIRALREKHPQSKILVACEEKSMPIFSAFPHANLCVKDEYWNLQNLIRTADEVYDFGGIATFLKREMRLDPIEATFKTTEMPLPKDKALCRPHIVVTLDEGKKMQARLKRDGVDIEKDKIIAIALESSTANRNWPFIYVRALTERLTAEGYKVVWLSESKDLGNTYFLGCDCGYELTMAVKDPPANFSWKCPDCKKENITGELKHPDGVINWSGKTNLREAMALIALTDCFVGPNSGLMVVSTALGIPTVGLFGAFNPKMRAKFYDKFIGLWGKVACAPCNEHWTECHLGYPAPCMKVLSVDNVHQAVLKLLTSYPRAVIGKLPIE